ncbi:T-box transcription factor TBX18-like isoform X2 [Dreissena polymorpha]|uniref:T-box domain-containing protein n=1 Tax=Dreissena polymorpha TaxID=45954 RepID=A0A9D4CZP8_DREPO|nr:T-box transcription factor TBX18-like isoform X2 [Dreissena polymorpha]KAH3735139.1 hypothetical protein DPMN_041600 [Dreissena polymorpha]
MIYFPMTDKHGDVIKMELCQGELWQAFHSLGTEMIITKTGRRMFPALRIRVSGLKKLTKYRVAMDFVPVDKHKYRYVYHSSRWMVAGVGDSLKGNQSYEHPESPMAGEVLSAQVVSFEKIKLTNNEAPAPGQISLLSMQKFQPRITITDKGDSSCSVSVTFPQTSFIAVTAYQNQEITRLKIARNPFAKGFREAGKCRSSLEAMMASFGVVLDGRKNLTPPLKRKLSEMDEECTDAKSTDNHVSISASQSSYSTHNLACLNISGSCYSGSPSIPTLYPAFRGPVSTQGLQTNKKSTSPLSTLSAGFDYTKQGMRPVFISNQTLPVYVPSTRIQEVHPAFRLSSFAHIDPLILDAYYKSLLSYPSMQNNMMFSQSVKSVNHSDTKHDKFGHSVSNAFDSIHDDREIVLNLCTT